MNPLKNNLFVVELIGEDSYTTEKVADVLIKEKITEGYIVNEEKYWREYFYLYVVKWYSIIK